MRVSLLSYLATAAAQSPWTGNMHPSLGFPPGCNISKGGDCTRSYSELEAAGVLWPCPAGLPTAKTCGSNFTCVPGQGDNPTCKGLSATSPCCCPKQGCAVEPTFNWIIGVCKGGSCACGANARAPACGNGRCGGQCNGTIVPCCFGADVSPLEPYYNEGTHAKVNYLAAYSFNAASSQWEIVQDSSFNTDARFPTYDLMQPYGGLPQSQAWLAPQPGGSVFWSLGYYPAGVRGVGGQGGVMFVLSTEDWFGGTWYMLNQVALDRGPANARPTGPSCPVNDNCWASGNSGEMDWLEPGWNNPLTAAQGYRQSFSTQNNQVGRCFQGGVNGGGFGSPNYLLTEPSPLQGGAPEAVVYIAVIDSVGTWVYRVPADSVQDVWPGLGRTTASAVLQRAPSRRPDSVNPGNTSYGATFTSNCQARTFTEAQAQQCEFNGQQGFCVRAVLRAVPPLGAHLECGLPPSLSPSHTHTYAHNTNARIPYALLPPGRATGGQTTATLPSPCFQTLAACAM